MLAIKHFYFVLFILLQIKKLNLDIALFVKELNSYIENGTEINDETIKLMSESVFSINKLQKLAQFRETLSNESGFVESLNNEMFEYRHCIVCRLCSVSSSSFFYTQFEVNVT